MFVSDLLVFDEYVVGPTSGSAVYTAPALNHTLANMDQMAIFTVCDNVNQADSIFVAIDHSCDGRNWTLKGATPEINATNNGIDATGPKAAWGYDRGNTPTLAQVRLKIYFGLGTTKGHIRVYVTSRDPRG